jgi:DNA-binding transcriptional MerR regulator
VTKEPKSYSIKEVSKVSGVAQHVLRYWETEFPLLRPRKNLSGRREYSKIDIDLIMRIKHLLYEEEYTIAGAKKKLAGGSDSRGGEAVRHLLDEISKELREIIKLLE